jgi:hypothetical protein
MEMNENQLKQFREAFADQMLKLECNFNVAIFLKNISYNDSGFTSKIEVRNLTKDGVQMIDPNKENRAKYAIGKVIGHINVAGGVLGKTFILVDGREIHIDDFETKSHKYPIIGYVNGKKIKCSPLMIKAPKY